MFLLRQGEGAPLGVQFVETLLEARPLGAVDFTQQFRLALREVGRLVARLQMQEPARNLVHLGRFQLFNGSQQVFDREFCLI